MTRSDRIVNAVLVSLMLACVGLVLAGALHYVVAAARTPHYRTAAWHCAL